MVLLSCRNITKFEKVTANKLMESVKVKELREQNT